MLDAHSVAGRHKPGDKLDVLTEELDVLFGLSDKLSETLRPIQPSNEFVAGLQASLTDGWALTMAQRRRLNQLVKTLGVVFSVLAVAAMVTRLVGLVIAALGQSRRSNIDAVPR